MPNYPVPRHNVSYAYLDSPVGSLLVAGDEAGLWLISFPTGSRTQQPYDGWRRDARHLSTALRQLDEYFAGKRRIFELPLQMDGTPFQNSVWSKLAGIPCGTTISYTELANRVGRPTAHRAVGAANGANPLPIVLPCHRVVGANGALTGFGGGIETKRFLLEHEQKMQSGASRRGQAGGLRGPADESGRRCNKATAAGQPNLSVVDEGIISCRALAAPRSRAAATGAALRT